MLKGRDVPAPGPDAHGIQRPLFTRKFISSDSKKDKRVQFSTSLDGYFFGRNEPIEYPDPSDLASIRKHIDKSWFLNICKSIRKTYTFQDAVPSIKFTKEPIIPLEHLKMILAVGGALLSQLPNVLTIDVPAAPLSAAQLERAAQESEQLPDGTPRLVLVGDTHGTFEVLEKVLTAEGFPSGDTHYLFNGDYIDRGSFSVEVFATVLALHVCAPRRVHLLRGNHETRETAEAYTFARELQEKYGEEEADDLFETFIYTFQRLPLAAVVGGEVCVVHGGLSARPDFSVATIDRLCRFREPMKSPSAQSDDIACFDPLQDILWADPAESGGCAFNAARQVSVLFSADATRRFLLASGGLALLVRSHTCVPGGSCTTHGGRALTIFSVPNYLEPDSGAYLVLLRGAGAGAPLLRVRRHFSTSQHAHIVNQPFVSLTVERDFGSFFLQSTGFDHLLDLF